MPKLVTSGEVHLRGLAPGQHSGGDLTGSGIESYTLTTLAMPLTPTPTAGLDIKFFLSKAVTRPQTNEV